MYVTSSTSSSRSSYSSSSSSSMPIADILSTEDRVNLIFSSSSAASLERLNTPLSRELAMIEAETFSNYKAAETFSNSKAYENEEDEIEIGEDDTESKRSAEMKGMQEKMGGLSLEKIGAGHKVAAILPPLQGNGTVKQNIGDPFYTPFYHKGIDSDQTTELLKNHPEGTFLIRDSSEANMLTISLKIVNDKIDNVRFGVSNGRYYQIERSTGKPSKLWAKSGQTMEEVLALFLHDRADKYLTYIPLKEDVEKSLFDTMNPKSGGTHTSSVSDRELVPFFHKESTGQMLAALQKMQRVCSQLFFFKKCYHEEIGNIKVRELLEDHDKDSFLLHYDSTLPEMVIMSFKVPKGICYLHFGCHTDGRFYLFNETAEAPSKSWTGYGKTLVEVLALYCKSRGFTAGIALDGGLIHFIF